jgi:hypothetical protein
MPETMITIGVWAIGFLVLTFLSAFAISFAFCPALMVRPLRKSQGHACFLAMRIVGSCLENAVPYGPRPVPLSSLDGFPRDSLLSLDEVEGLLYTDFLLDRSTAGVQDCMVSDPGNRGVP